MRAVILDVLEWLAGDECQDNDDAHLIAGLGRRLRSAGLPVDRLALHLRTLHPEILGRTVAWSPNEPVQVMDRENGFDLSTNFIGSPIRHVMQTLEHLSIRMDKPGSHQWTYLDIYKDRELVELIVVPLASVDGPVSAAAFCTKQPDGFTREQRESIERIAPALRNVCELRTLRKFDLTLLDTYTGKATAQRVLAGQIRRGQVESLEAALMICDLRDYTEVTNCLPGGKVLELLDSYFHRVVPAITEGGGEIVKFMSGAVLAFFQRDVAADSCRAAMQAARTALDNLGRSPASHAPMNAGIALHYGEMSYGSIGSGRRLDFTVIGPDVNLMSRIQAVCASTGEPLLVTQRFAELVTAGDLVSVGHHSVEGFQEPVHLYAQSGPQRQA
jgi:adenylate cyclase